MSRGQWDGARTRCDGLGDQITSIANVRRVHFGECGPTQSPQVHPTRHERPESQLRSYCALEMAWLLSGSYPEPGPQVLAGDPEATGLSSRPPTEAGRGLRGEAGEGEPPRAAPRPDG